MFVDGRGTRSRPARPVALLGYGRFVQTDPIGYGDGMNWYNYVKSDPINKRDPRGLDTDIVIKDKKPHEPPTSPPGRMAEIPQPALPIGFDPSRDGDSNGEPDIIVKAEGNCKGAIVIGGVCVNDIRYDLPQPKMPKPSWTPSRIWCAVRIALGPIAGLELFSAGKGLLKGKSALSIGEEMAADSAKGLIGRTAGRVVVIAGVAVVADYAFNDGRAATAVVDWVCPNE